MNKVALITGSSGLIGSEAVAYFDQRGWEVHGVDNNMRADFFGPGATQRGTSSDSNPRASTFITTRWIFATVLQSARPSLM